ncbi:hypothetical protein, partial [Gluconobacter cerinus]|uniref:hypothetical protein n=1 Tax=Gluconobacter cerinus TaxID=38307 RepID=UPI001B8BACB7
ICSKRRATVTPETLNQIAESQKSPAKHINQGFFDPSKGSGLPAARKQEWMFDKSLIMFINRLITRI